MSIDDIKNGQRINCNGVYGTVIGERSARNRRFVVVKMDNGFTLKINVHASVSELTGDVNVCRTSHSEGEEHKHDACHIAVTLQTESYVK